MKVDDSILMRVLSLSCLFQQLKFVVENSNYSIGDVVIEVRSVWFNCAKIFSVFGHLAFFSSLGIIIGKKYQAIFLSLQLLMEINSQKKCSAMYPNSASWPIFLSEYKVLIRFHKPLCKDCGASSCRNRMHSLHSDTCLCGSDYGRYHMA